VFAAIRLDFDPSASVLGMSVRLETLALAGVIFLVLLLAALRSPISRVLIGWFMGGPLPGLLLFLDSDSQPDDQASGPKLRHDDLILIAFGAIPGAVVGGRLDYALIHLDYYKADPGALIDPGRGGFGLTLAVVLGTLTAIAVARLLAAPIDRWLGVASVPVLLGLGLGKLTMALGGAGQGSYSGAWWATSYVRTGVWGSINPTFPALPSQVIEGGLVLAVMVLVVVLPLLLRLRLRRWRVAVRPALAPRRDWPFLIGGRRYLTVVGLWAVARFAAAFTWRDARVLGPLVAEQLVLLIVAVGALCGPASARATRRARAAWSASRAARQTASAEMPQSEGT
jgi:hypothetical protein